ncbi:major facilitator superfamily permease, partial [Lacticaseibacillus paracasei subsp. paracasei Lpp41]
HYPTQNTRLAQAFSHTYLIGALIVLCLSPVAFWTDRLHIDTLRSE